MTREVRTITVVGGGLAGALMAVHLAKAGYQVAIYERRPDLRQQTLQAGRSINLALSLRGIHALAEVGLADEVLAHAVPMKGRMMHGLDGSLTFQPYGTDESQVINSVSRGGLNQLLLDAAERHDNVRLFFQHRCLDVDLDAPAVVFLDEATGQEVRVESDLVIGSDGAFSAIRARMQRSDRFDYRQDYLEHGYKELSIQPADKGGFRMEKNALHIWPRKSFMMIALPNEDGSYTCTLFWPFDGVNGFNSLSTEDDVQRHFQRWFPDAVPLMPDLTEMYAENPTSSLVTVRCGPWVHEDKVLLLGDAAHAVVPFYGQGMNCAFEDCTVLSEMIRRHAPNWRLVLSEYYQERKPNADALADLAIKNFIEMRDKVASTRFLLRKRIEGALHKLLPEQYVPLYSMVTFSRIPYGEARRIGERQDMLWRHGWKFVLGAVVFLVLLLS